MGLIKKATQQDEISVPTSKRLFSIRQDRKFPEEDSFFMKSGEDLYPVLDYSPFGLAIFTKSANEFDKETEAVLELKGITVSDVFVRTVRSEKTVYKGSDGFKLGLLVIGNPIQIEKIEALESTSRALQEHTTHFENEAKIPTHFKQVTLEIKEWLQTLEQNVNSLEKNTFEYSGQKVTSFESVVTQLVSQYIEKNIYPLYSALEEIIKKCSTQETKICFEYFRQKIGPFMFQSSYANRAYQKPRGYAGDFEMMRSIYNQEKRGRSLFGRCMEQYFIDVPESQAVRNRGEYLLDKITQTLRENPKAKILSVASGPAYEIQLAIARFPSLFSGECEIHLIDQDVEALKECQRAILSLARRHGIESKFYFHNSAIKNIIEQGLQIESLDLIYTAGLFDYLSNPVANFAATRLRSSLSKTGKLVIGNFDISAPNRFGLSLVTDWHLIYRTREDLNNLFGMLGNLKIESEPLGINLFAVISSE